MYNLVKYQTVRLNGIQVLNRLYIVVMIRVKGRKSKQKLN